MKILNLVIFVLAGFAMSNAESSDFKLPFTVLTSVNKADAIRIETLDAKKLKVSLTVGKAKTERVTVRVISDGRAWDGGLVLDLGKGRILNISQGLQATPGPRIHYESKGRLIPLTE
jgi:hypothetical protein